MTADETTVKTELFPEYGTPPQAAKYLSVGHDKILGFIRSGELRAVNLASHQGGRPRWRIHRADLEAFLVRRAATPPPKQTRRRRAKSKNVTEYY